MNFKIVGKNTNYNRNKQFKKSKALSSLLKKKTNLLTKILIY